MKRYPLGSLLNLRDLGGYPSAHGTTQHGRYLRSDLPHDLAETDLVRLRDLGVVTTIDLRMAQEVAERPSALAGLDGLAYHHVDLMAEAGFRLTDEADTGRFYRAMAMAKQSMTTIYAAMSEADGSVHFHCTVGKDRTGVVAALLLLHAGVAREDVVADYQVSQTYIRPIIDRLRLQFPDFPAYFGYSKPEYMTDFLDLFFQEFADTDAYFAWLGLSAEARERLRTKLL